MPARLPPGHRHLRLVPRPLGGLILISTAYLAGVTSVWGGILAGILASGGIVFIAVDRGSTSASGSPSSPASAHPHPHHATPRAWPPGVTRFAARLAAARSDGAARPRRRRLAPQPSRCRVRRPTPIRPILTVGRPPRPLRRRGRGRRRLAPGPPPATVVGLIGPNGAGKTSVIDAITGFARATGDIEVVGRVAGRTGPHARVRKGLVRTFQALELYDDLSVEENVSVAAFAADGDAPAPTPSTGRSTWSASRTCGDRPAGDLSQGAAPARVHRPGLCRPAVGAPARRARRRSRLERERSGSASASGPSPTPAPVCCSSITTSRSCSACATHIYVLDFGAV